MVSILLKQIRWFCWFSADKTEVVIKAEMAAMIMSTTRSSIKVRPAEGASFLVARINRSWPHANDPAGWKPATRLLRQSYLMAAGGSFSFGIASVFRMNFPPSATPCRFQGDRFVTRTIEELPLAGSLFLGSRCPPVPFGGCRKTAPPPGSACRRPPSRIALQCDRVVKCF